MFWFAVRHKDRLRTVPFSLSDGIEEVKDVDYFGDGKSEHMLDIYFRSGENTGRPVVLSIHGGGWMSGVKENNRNFCIRLAERGFTVFNVNYLRRKPPSVTNFAIYRRRFPSLKKTPEAFRAHPAASHSSETARAGSLHFSQRRFSAPVGCVKYTK